MDFKLPPAIEAYRSRCRDFVRNHVLPYDTTPESFDEHENIRPDLLAILRAKAKEEGLWAPQMPKARGGQSSSTLLRKIQLCNSFGTSLH